MPLALRYPDGSITDWTDAETIPEPWPDGALPARFPGYPPGYPDGGPWYWHDGEVVTETQRQVAADVAAELALAKVRAERAALAKLKADKTKPPEYQAAAAARDAELKTKEDAEVARGRGK